MKRKWDFPLYVYDGPVAYVLGQHDFPMSRPVGFRTLHCVNRAKADPSFQATRRSVPSESCGERKRPEG